MNFFAFAVGNARREFGGRMAGEDEEYLQRLARRSLYGAFDEDMTQCPRCITGLVKPGDRICATCEFKDQQYQRATRGINAIDGL